MYGYYEDITNGRAAFYEVTPQPNGMAQVRWGKIGTRGQSQYLNQSEAFNRARKKTSSGNYEFVRSVSIEVPKVQQAINDLDTTSSVETPAETKSSFNFADWLEA